MCDGLYIFLMKISSALFKSPKSIFFVFFRPKSLL
jgi:hypothetical protein